MVRHRLSFCVWWSLYWLLTLTCGRRVENPGRVIIVRDQVMEKGSVNLYPDFCTFYRSFVLTPTTNLLFLLLYVFYSFFITYGKSDSVINGLSWDDRTYSSVPKGYTKLIRVPYLTRMVFLYRVTGFLI